MLVDVCRPHVTWEEKYPKYFCSFENWTEQTLLELLDPTLRGSYSINEAIRCICIGLLCVQENPSVKSSMTTIALMMNSYSIRRWPAPFLHGRTPDRLKCGLDSDQSTTFSIPWSLLKHCA